MDMLAFDTLAFAKKLKGSGYTDAQAEALAEAQMEVFRQMLESTLATKDDVRDMVTKADIQRLEAATKAEIQALEAATKADIQRLEAATRADIQRLEAATKAEIQELRGEIQRLEATTKAEIQRLDQKIDVAVQNAVKDLKIWFGGMLALAIGVMATLVKVL